MTKKLQPIISSKLFFGFCLIEFLILVALKVIQAIFPGAVVEVFPMFWDERNPCQVYIMAL